MLGKTYRLQVENNSGVAITVTIKTQRFKFGSDGAMVLEAAATSLCTDLAVASGAGSVSACSTVDNGTDLYFGGDFEISVTAATTPNGAVTVRLQRSVDGGATWPDDKSGEHVAGFNLTVSGTRRKTGRVE